MLTYIMVFVNYSLHFIFTSYQLLLPQPDALKRKYKTAIHS